MNPFEMVVAIVIIATIGKVMNTRYQSRHGITKDEHGNQSHAAQQLLGDQDIEIKKLKERVQILERIVTENNNAVDLDREIESLRSK